MSSILSKLNMSFLAVDSGGLSYRGMSVTALQKQGVPDAAILQAVKDWLGGEINAVAERMRIAVLTPGAGQAMEYQEVQAQSDAVLAAPSSASAATYPMLAASIGLDVDPTTGAKATDVLGVARAVQAQKQAWMVLGAAIRAARLNGKAAVGVASTIAAAVAAFDAITWPAKPG